MSIRPIAGLLLALVLLPGAPALAQGPARTLVVPFENARSEPRYQWLSEASAVLLTDGLRGRGAGAITRSERISAFDQLHLPVAASLSRATVIKVGQLLGAAEVIVGSFTVEGDDLEVTAHAIRVDVGRVRPQAVERGPLTDLFTIFDRLARRLAQDAPKVGPTPEAPSLEAFESYIKGLLAENPATKADFLEAALRDQAGFDRARLALWEVRRDQGDHESALATVKDVAPDSSWSRRARFAAGVSLLELRQYEEAFGAFKALLDENPDGPGASNAAVLNNLGVIQIRRGATATTGTATYYLTKAAEEDTDPDYLFNLGYAYVAEGNHQGALYWLREALRRDPADPDAHFVLAVALQATGSGVEAARERDLARQLSSRYEELERRPAGAGALLPVGLERLAMSPDATRALRADQAIADSTQREHRELAAFHLERGRRFYEKEQDREAMADLRRAVYLSPYESQAHLLIGRIHLRGGRAGDAIDALKISIWSEETAAVRLALAEAYVKAGNPEAARREAERALALDPGCEDARRLLGTIK